jgi:hypothetical protein
MCMMIRGAADRLWLMKAWCVHWESRFKGRDDSLFRYFPCIFHKFYAHFFSAASFNDAGIQKLVPRYDRCLNNGGNYVER